MSWGLYKLAPDGAVARRMAFAMRKRGMGVTDLSAKSGVSLCSVSNYVNNKAIPSRRTIARLASALDVQQEWLAGIAGAEEVVQEVKKEEEMPSALISAFQALSDKNKAYLLETAILLQVKQGLEAKGVKAS